MNKSKEEQMIALFKANQEGLDNGERNALWKLGRFVDEKMDVFYKKLAYKNLNETQEHDYQTIINILGLVSEEILEMKKKVGGKTK